MEGSYKIVTTEKVLQTGPVECLFLLEIYILKCCTTAETAVIHFLTYFFLKNGPIPAPLCLFSLFSQYNFNN